MTKVYIRYCDFCKKETKKLYRQKKYKKCADHIYKNFSQTRMTTWLMVVLSFYLLGLSLLFSLLAAESSNIWFVAVTVVSTVIFATVGTIVLVTVVPVIVVDAASVADRVYCWIMIKLIGGKENGI
jgi:hypothetical protein